MRVLDTRTRPAGAMRVNETIPLTVTGAGGVPISATAVTFNLTVVGASKPGYVTAYPCGQAIPSTSSIDVASSDARANLVTVKVGSIGRVCLFAMMKTDVIVDLAGYWTSSTATTGSLYQPLAPRRLVDTRRALGATRLAAGGSIRIRVAGAPGIPATATAAALNVTVTDPSRAGYVSIYPCDATRTDVSNLDYSAGETIPNASVVRLGADGTVCLFSMSATDVVVDVDGVWHP
jgi:hypothetical protein